MEESFPVHVCHSARPAFGAALRLSFSGPGVSAIFAVRNMFSHSGWQLLIYASLLSSTSCFPVSKSCPATQQIICNGRRLADGCASLESHCATGSSAQRSLSLLPSLSSRDSRILLVTGFLLASPEPSDGLPAGWVDGNLWVWIWNFGLALPLSLLLVFMLLRSKDNEARCFVWTAIGIFGLCGIRFIRSLGMGQHEIDALELACDRTISLD